MTNGGALSANSAAALVGAYGLRAAINSNTAIYVTDDTPAAEPRYRARFYFDPNSITMSSGNAHYIFYGYSGTSTVVLRIEYRFQSPNRQLRAALVNNATTWTTSSWFTISDAPHFIEIDLGGGDRRRREQWVSDNLDRWHAASQSDGSGQRHPPDRSGPAGSRGRHRHRHAGNVLLRCFRVETTNLYRTGWHCHRPLTAHIVGSRGLGGLPRVTRSIDRADWDTPSRTERYVPRKHE